MDRPMKLVLLFFAVFGLAQVRCAAAASTSTTLECDSLTSSDLEVFRTVATNHAGDEKTVEARNQKFQLIALVCETTTQLKRKSMGMSAIPTTDTLVLTMVERNNRKFLLPQPIIAKRFIVIGSRRLTQKTIDQYDLKAPYSEPLTIWRPAYSDDSRKAVVFCSWFDGWMGGAGYLVHLEKQDHQWMIKKRQSLYSM